MGEQVAKPPGRTAGEYSRDYPRITLVEGDENMYVHLESPKRDNLFAAYDPREIKLGRIRIVGCFDYLYTPRSHFWSDVFFLTVPNLDWCQSVRMAISVQRVVNVDPERVIIAGSNDQNALVDGSVPSSEAVGEAIMTLLSAMVEAVRSIRQSFARQLVKIIFVLSPGYALLPEPLQFVYVMVVLLAKDDLM